MSQPFDRKILDESYEAELVVKRTRITKTANGNGYFDDPAVTSKGELASVKITSTTLTGLQLKIKQHTDLLEDE
jgi:hypothetical protein